MNHRHHNRREDDEREEQLLTYLLASVRSTRGELDRVATIETVLKMDLDRVQRGTTLANVHLKTIEDELKALRARHEKKLFVFFVSTEGGKTAMQIGASSTAVLLLLLAESAKGNQIPLSAGPFTVDSEDPNSTCNYTPGSADQSTPDSWTPNGSGALGTVTVEVADEGQTPPLIGTGSFDVIAGGGGGPVVPDTLTVDFQPATPAALAAFKARVAAKKA